METGSDNGKASTELLEQMQRVQTMSALVSRMALSSRLGQSYGGDRNLYETLGYKTELTYADYYNQFIRQDIAQAVITRPVKVTWSGPLAILETREGNETSLEKDWLDLERRLRLKSTFVRLDKLTGLGRYGVLLLGFNDVKKVEDFAQPVKLTKGLDLLYTRPLGESSATIADWERDVRSPRYGKPLYYNITLMQPVGGNSMMRVHYSRIIHVIEGALESETEGLPRLEVVFNRLQDLEKLVGGSAEMFWRGARPGYAGEIDPDFTLNAEQESALKSQLDEYEHNLRRFLTMQGVSLKSLETQISDPKNHVDVQLMMISAVTGIPKRILSGSERGELASTQDAAEWISYVQGRREEFAEPHIIRPFVDLMIDYGILPKPSNGYEIEWADLFAVSEKDKAEIGRIRATALREYFVNPLTVEIVPPKAFYEFFLGFSRQQIELINEMEQDEVFKEMQSIAGEEEIPGLTVPISNPTADKTENK